MIKHALRLFVFLCFTSVKYNPHKMFIDDLYMKCNPRSSMELNLRLKPKICRQRN